MRDKRLRTPLMLTVFTLAYRSGTLPKGLGSQSAEATLREGFAAFVDSMLTRRGQLKEGTADQYVRWLTYLATQMRARDLTVFSLEDLDPTWLADEQSPQYKTVTRFLRKVLKDRKIEPAEEFIWETDLNGKRKLVRRRLEERSRLKPNEGIWRSLKHGTIGGTRKDKAIRALTILPMAGVAVSVWVGAPLMGAFYAAWTAASYYAFGEEWGLDAFVQHFTVRLLLSRTDSLPWDLVDFLDEAAERLLLHKAGGSYMFAHALLLDFFANAAQNTEARS
jgi:hypothetical protein